MRTDRQTDMAKLIVFLQLCEKPLGIPLGIRKTARPFAFVSSHNRAEPKHFWKYPTQWHQLIYVLQLLVGGPEWWQLSRCNGVVLVWFVSTCVQEQGWQPVPKTYKQITCVELLSFKAVFICNNHQALRNLDMTSETYERLVTFQ